VPKSIIHKAGRLTPSEWIVVKKHSVDGEKILREEGVDPICSRVAFEHHMRYDMRGYPTPKKGYKPHKSSHIIRIADSYDALTTKRPYRKQMGPYGAIKMMYKSRGAEFHPQILDVFYNVLGNVPIGSVLKLNTGETVLVIDIDKKQGMLPRVRVLKDEKGKDVESGRIIDLNEKGSDGKTPLREIVEIVDQHVRDVNVGSYLVQV
jgi:HD-GYP domain-containing protein (c-di-GMP phosphodiesterase class II)